MIQLLKNLLSCIRGSIGHYVFVCVSFSNESCSHPAFSTDYSSHILIDFKVAIIHLVGLTIVALFVFTLVTNKENKWMLEALECSRIGRRSIFLEDCARRRSGIVSAARIFMF